MPLLVFYIHWQRLEEALAEGINRLAFAELKYVIDFEWIYEPVDFFIRLTGALLFNIDCVTGEKTTIEENYNRHSKKQ